MQCKQCYANIVLPVDSRGNEVILAGSCCPSCKRELPGSSAVGMEIAHALDTLKRLAQPAIEFYNGQLAARLFDLVLSSPEAVDKMRIHATEAIVEAAKRNVPTFLDKWLYELLTGDPTLRQKVANSLVRSAIRAFVKTQTQIKDPDPYRRQADHVKKTPYEELIERCREAIFREVNDVVREHRPVLKARIADQLSDPRLITEALSAAISESIRGAKT